MSLFLTNGSFGLEIGKSVYAMTVIRSIPTHFDQAVQNLGASRLEYNANLLLQSQEHRGQLLMMPAACQDDRTLAVAPLGAAETV